MRLVAFSLKMKRVKITSGDGSAKTMVIQNIKHPTSRVRDGIG